MYRFRPVLEMKAYPIHEYPAKCRQAAGIMHMLMNNLDPRVAQVYQYFHHVPTSWKCNVLQMLMMLLFALVSRGVGHVRGQWAGAL